MCPCAVSTTRTSTPDANCGADQQPTVAVLRRVRMLLGLDEILDCDQSGERSLPVDDGELLDLVASQQSERGLGRDTFACGDERSLGHHIGDATVLVHLEAHVAVGDDPDERAGLVRDGQPGDPESCAHRVDLGEGVRRLAGDRVGDHSGLGPLDRLHLCGLVLPGEVAVQDPHAAGSRHGDGHPRLGDRVHRRTDERNPQPDLTGELTGRVHRTGDQVRRSRQ